MLHLALGAIIISFSPLFVKFVAPLGVSGAAAAFHRMLIGGLALILATLFSREPNARPWRMPAAGHWWSLACAALFAADLVAWHLSILYVGPGLATLLGNFQVFLLALWGIFVLHEKLRLRFFAGIALSMAGLFAIVAPDWAAAGPDYHLGVIYGLATGVFYTGCIITLGRAMAACGEGGQLAATAAFSFLTAVLLAPVLLLNGEPLVLPPGKALLLMTGYGLSTQFLGWILISRGLRETRMSLAGLILLLQPALAYVWDLVLLAKPTGVAELAGVSACLAGIAIGARK